MKCTIIGATGYTAVELIRMIEQHPHLEIVSLVSDSKATESITEIYTFMNKKNYSLLREFSLAHLEEVGTELIFLATPSGISKQYLEQLKDWKGKVIDLSGDLRLDQISYEHWYEKPAVEPMIQATATYGLSEWNREAIKTSRLIANPGCYATAVLLGLLPFLKEQVIEPVPIIIHASSGLSGAGKSFSEQTHHVRSNENMRLYKMNRHQHIPEIESVIQTVTGQDAIVSFATHLIPINRGIMATMTLTPRINKSETQWREWLQAFYENEPFVRINGNDPEIKSVVGSNYCDLTIYADARTGHLTVVSVIDNMQKGAVGQAIQNANLMCGYEEALGLTQQPLFI
ncbi:N-acetyl-gamma-glutamyl-phosphate reductase [Exiguobacterium oxidotolerans]|uniref:N-acetyl-gamma-glutamyl-phosphate reductase n=1 Tax=Exiguobacterium oxidotolerans TaxID=223958 RepID=A0A653I3S2_9BACL|nr:N-acetyl-gamma-glutamyl-phosphate reductase [Exiguobacterium oxidotolerans]VWX33353.1 N-acetyl-gamma-glutamyl-phosphate reductase [Exiguobacterium oxidotolerans]